MFTEKFVFVQHLLEYSHQSLLARQGQQPSLPFSDNLNNMRIERRIWLNQPTFDISHASCVLRAVVKEPFHTFLKSREAIQDRRLKHHCRV